MCVCVEQERERSGWLAGALEAFGENSVDGSCRTGVTTGSEQTRWTYLPFRVGEKSKS